MLELGVNEICDILYFGYKLTGTSDVVLVVNLTKVPLILFRDSVKTLFMIKYTSVSTSMVNRQKVLEFLNSIYATIDLYI